MPEEDRATVIGNMQKLVKIACVVLDILADRQTDTQTYSSQYFRTPYGGEVKNNKKKLKTKPTWLVATVVNQQRKSMWQV